MIQDQDCEWFNQTDHEKQPMKQGFNDNLSKIMQSVRLSCIKKNTKTKTEHKKKQTKT